MRIKAENLGKEFAIYLIALASFVVSFVVLSFVVGLFILAVNWWMRILPSV